jgi:hypothetical protein
MDRDELSVERQRCVDDPSFADRRNENRRGRWRLLGVANRQQRAIASIE